MAVEVKILKDTLHFLSAWTLFLAANFSEKNKCEMARGIS